MAEGWLRHYLGDSAEIYSAGIEAHGVNPYAVQTMADAGIDISGHTSNRVEEYRGQNFDYFITLCDSARERCSWFPHNATHLHYHVPDPADATGTEKEIVATYRQVSEQLRSFAEVFAGQCEVPL